jgi:hypothetical protein
VACATLLFTLPSTAEDDEPSPQIALDYLKLLIKLKVVASSENAEWIEEKESLKNRMILLEKELAQLKTLLGSAGENETESSDRRTALINEESILKAAAVELRQSLNGLENALLQLSAYFPPPLLATTQDYRQRLRDRSLSRHNRDRLKDLLAVLLEAEKFQRSISTDREWRMFRNKREIEVRVIYFGLGQAFYVGEGNQEAGIGYPEAQGWRWEPRTGIAKTVRKAIEILEDHPEQAHFQSLPVKLRPVSP